MKISTLIVCVVTTSAIISLHAADHSTKGRQFPTCTQVSATGVALYDADGHLRTQFSSIKPVHVLHEPHVQILQLAHHSLSAGLTDPTSGTFRPTSKRIVEKLKDIKDLITHFESQNLQNECQVCAHNGGIEEEIVHV